MSVPAPAERTNTRHKRNETMFRFMAHVRFGAPTLIEIAAIYATNHESTKAEIVMSQQANGCQTKPDRRMNGKRMNGKRMVGKRMVGRRMGGRRMVGRRMVGRRMGGE